MENQIPVTPIVDNPQTVMERSKPNNFLVILLSVLLFLSVAIIGFFIYQTQKLTKELTVLKSAFPIPTASNGPTFKPVSSTDPTINWKTYTDKLHKIEFNYPSEYTFQSNQGSYYIMSPLLPPGKGYELRDGELKVEFYFNPIRENDTLDKYASEIKTNSESNILNEEKIKIANKEVIHFQFQGHGDSDLYLLIHNGFRIQIAKYPIETSRQLEFDQILSTFKFIN